MRSNEEHRQAGTYRDDRHAPAKLAPSKPPEPPKHLSKEAKKKWKEVAAELARQGLFTSLDIDAVAGFVETWCVWRQAKDTVAAEGSTYRHGELIKTHPAVVIMQTTARELQVWLNMLGLSQAGRKRMRIELGGAEKAKGVAARDRSKGPPPPEHIAGKIG